MIPPHLRHRGAPTRVRPGYWFAPKAYGYGAYPATLTGWLATAAYLLAVGCALAAISDDGGKIIAVTCITIGWLSLVATKTDGGWRWRWGGK